LKHFENELQGADFEGSRKSKDERLAIVNKTLLEENIQLKDYLTKVEDEMKNVKQAYFECFYNYKAKIQELKYKLQEDDIEKSYFSTLITSLFKICNQIPELAPLFKEKAEKSKLWHKIKLRKLQVHSTGTDVFEKAEILEKDEAEFDSEGCEDHSKLEEEIDIYYKRDENFTFSKDRNSEIFSFANGRESEFCSPFPERRKQESLLFQIQETKEVPKLQSKTNAKAEGKTESFDNTTMENLLTESVELECSLRTTRKTDGLNQISEDNHSMHNTILTNEGDPDGDGDGGRDGGENIMERKQDHRTSGNPFQLRKTFSSSHHSSHQNLHSSSHSLREHCDLDVSSDGENICETEDGLNLINQSLNIANFFNPFFNQQLLPPLSASSQKVCGLFNLGLCVFF
jgi:hypothetical protein